MVVKIKTRQKSLCIRMSKIKTKKVLTNKDLNSIVYIVVNENIKKHFNIIELCFTRRNSRFSPNSNAS